MAAAVIAFLDAAWLVVCFFLLINWWGPLLSLGLVAIAVVLVWGAIAALRGSSRVILFVASLVSVAVGLLLGGGVGALISMVVGLAIPILLATGSSKDFFRATPQGPG